MLFVRQVCRLPRPERMHEIACICPSPRGISRRPPMQKARAWKIRPTSKTRTPSPPRSGWISASLMGLELTLMYLLSVP